MSFWRSLNLFCKMFLKGWGYRKMENQFELHFSQQELSKINSIIRNKDIWLNYMEIEYRKKKNIVLVRFRGVENMKLSKNYQQMIDSQLHSFIDEIVLTLITNIRANFTLSTTVDPIGRFSLSNMDLRFKVDCGQSNKVSETFREPFRIFMPFATYLNTVTFKGHKHRMAFIEAHMTLTSEDLVEAIDKPTIAPRSYDQWHNMAYEAYEEAQKEYRYEVTIPCIEGEMYWDQKLKTLQFTFYEQKEYYTQ